MSSLLRRLLFVLLLSIVLRPSLEAQWSLVHPNLLPSTETVSAMQFRDGVVWAGAGFLWSSTDSGKTWVQSKSFPQSHISDVAFYDKLHCLVATEDKGVFFTNDGAQTWQSPSPQLPDLNFTKVGFGASANDLYALNIDGDFFASHDGGATWPPLQQGLDAQAVNSFGVGNNGSIYTCGATTNLNSHGVVSLSVTSGNTWTNQSGAFNADSWTLSVDSCDPNRLYITNEQWFEVTGGSSSSNFYLSTDAGTTWQATDSHTAPYLSGSMSTTNDGIFIGTRDGSGLHRSLDQGMTWKAIGGPNVKTDTRDIAAVNDNILLVADSAGNIWLTTNSGGDSVSGEQFVGTFAFSADSLFNGYTISCDTLTLPLFAATIGCRPPTPSGISIVGPDSNNFRIVNGPSDSIYIRWAPSGPGKQTAWLVANLDNGTSDSVALSGVSNSTPTLYAVDPTNLFGTDTLFVGCQPDTTSQVDLHIAACLFPEIISEKIVGVNSADYQIQKSIGVPQNLLDSANDVIISFLPSGAGLRSAMYELVLDDTTIDIPLAGAGDTTGTLSLTAGGSLRKIDTIGATDSIPIEVDHLLRPETIVVDLHYPTADLVYGGTVDTTGAIVDVPGTQQPGFSELNITDATSGKICAYSRFKVFSDTNYNPLVTYNLIDVPTELSTCSYVLPPPIVDTIVPLEGCADQMLSLLIHFGQSPVFNIQPNPSADGLVQISASQDVGTVTIEAYDMLGVMRETYRITLSSNVPASVSLPFESGTYFLRIASDADVRHATVVIDK